MSGSGDETFGDVVRRERLARKMPNGKSWTQEYLANEAGVDQGTVSQVELNRPKSHTSETVQKLARALGADPHDWLVMAGVVPAPLATPARPTEVTMQTRYGAITFDRAEAIAYVEAKPDPIFREQLTRAKRHRSPEAYERWVLKIYVAWSSNADLAVDSLDLDDVEHEV